MTMLDIEKIIKIFKIIKLFKIVNGFIIITDIVFKKLSILKNLSNVQEKDLIKFLKKIIIYETGLKLIRIGCKKDGGYLVPNILKKISYCFSPGVGDNSAFEDHLSQLGIKSFLLDGTVEYQGKYNFIKKNLNVFSDKKNITLKEWIKFTKIKEENLLLQMDIEGSEIDVVNSTSLSILKKFSIIIIEFHYFQSILLKYGLKIYRKLFKKVLKNFIICHIHPNNCCGTFKVDKHEIPRVMEITFVNKEMIQYKKLLNKNLPHKYDFKCCSGKKEIRISDIFYKAQYC